MTLFKPGKMFRRSIIAALSAAVIGLAFVSTAASARPGGGGGFRGGGFHGFHGGFHGGFRRFGPGIGLGIGLGLGYPYYASYYGDDDCLAPRRIWTPYGWRFRYVNVCGYDYY
jgi:hypothetical protein